MCGIAGAIQPREGTADFGPLIEEITQDQHPRGPDFRAIEEASSHSLKAVFGHNRLAIIDLSANANQPMWDAARRLCLIYNGEIYNYVELREQLRSLGHEFSTTSDTEVILEAYRAWGDEAFERFNGPFAFALFDLESERIVLARDRFGVKPLFYVADRDRVVFASTAGVCCRSLGLSPDPGYVAAGIAHGVYDDAAVAPFVGLSAVAPGTLVSVTANLGGALRTVGRVFYDLHDRVGSMVSDLAVEKEAALLDRLICLIDDAVGIRFRADVPVAVSLSGGLDSTSIATLASAQLGELIAFTFGDHTDPHGEGGIVQDFAAAQGISVKYVKPSDNDVAAAFLPTLQAQGAPFNSASVMAQYLLYEQVAAAGVRVLLGGQGGDEALMGYRKFQLFQLRERLGKRDYRETIELLPGLAKMLVAELPQARNYARVWHRYRDGPRHSALGLPTTAASSPHWLGDTEHLWERQVRDVTSTSLPSLLRYEDRNSMAHSVESRLPFLDYRLIEFAIALPASMKIRDGYGKWILREAMRGRVPDRIRLARNKRGFDVPQARWIERGLGKSIREALHERRHDIEARTAVPLDVDTAFSDRRLIHTPTTFAEATALTWIADHAVWPSQIVA